jgi:hypothetical protein
MVAMVPGENSFPSPFAAVQFPSGVDSRHSWGGTRTEPDNEISEGDEGSCRRAKSTLRQHGRLRAAKAEDTLNALPAGKAQALTTRGSREQLMREAEE